MPSSFVDIATEPVTSTTVLFPRSQLAVEGDLVYLVILADAAAVLTLPDTDWRQHATFTIGALIGITAFKYVGADEPESYTFVLSVYTAQRQAALMVYRGTQRDFAFNPVLYPHGFFAPAGSVGAIKTGTSTALTSVLGSNPTTMTDNARVMYFFVQDDAALGSPELDDVSPLEPMRARVMTTQFGILIVDVEYETPVSPTPVLSVGSSLNKPWSVFSVAFEVQFAENESLDSYKAKVLRGMWPPPYDNRFASNLGKLLTVIGGSDNDIGGLFGDADFLPDEVP